MCRGRGHPVPPLQKCLPNHIISKIFVVCADSVQAALVRPFLIWVGVLRRVHVCRKGLPQAFNSCNGRSALDISVRALVYAYLQPKFGGVFLGVVA